MTSQVSFRYIPILANGIPNEGIKEVYELLKKEGTLRWLFFAGECKSYKDFLGLVRDASNLVYIVIDIESKELVSIFWLNSRTVINCSVHVAFFKKYFGKATEISKEVLSWLFDELDFLESLLCFIPVTNKLANRFAERVGWIKVGTIPKLIKDDTTSNIVSGNMYYIIKDEV